eukprot:837946-Pyramimonas_sp.AAC.1
MRPRHPYWYTPNTFRGSTGSSTEGPGGAHPKAPVSVTPCVHATNFGTPLQTLRGPIGSSTEVPASCDHMRPPATYFQWP